MVGQLILGLTILVGIHEWGHLAAARMFGMRVEKYYIGFPPKVIGRKWGETEYALGAIPLGGFVKISGMIDESLDTKTLSAEPEPWEFRAKPAWQRLIVMLGGIIMNVITGIVVFIIMTFTYGDTYVPKDKLNENGVMVSELGQDIGLQNGDRILAVNGADFERDEDIFSSNNLVKSGFNLTIERSGETKQIDVPSDFIERLSDRKNRGTIVAPRSTFYVSDPQVKGDSLGLKTGDKFLTIDGKKITYYDEFRDYVRSNKCSTVDILVSREGDNFKIKAPVNHEGRIGIITSTDIKDKIVTENYTFGESLVRGTKQAFNVVWLNIQGFGKMFRGEVSVRKSLSGPVRIAEMFGTEFRTSKFWYLVGLLSMVLAFMNLLPIPALDGGHVMFLTWELITGKKPGDKFLENAQKFGMILLLGLMAFVIINDVLMVSATDEETVKCYLDVLKSAGSSVGLG